MEHNNNSSSVKLIRMVALDLDGTLLNNSHELSEITISTLRKLSDLGIIISIVTGRSSGSVADYLHQLNLSQPFVPVVCYNGAFGLLYSRDNSSNIFDKETLFEHPVHHESTDKLINFSKKLDLVMQVKNHNGSYYPWPAVTTTLYFYM